MKVYIYTLSHPITSEIRYVGKTRNPIQRYSNHLNKHHNKFSHKTAWIESLKKIKLRPVMEVLDEVPEDDWKFWERYWINQCLSWGFNLVNHTSGGEGLTMGNQTSFKKGNKSWNKDKGNTFICENCNTTFKACISTKRRFCSQNCASVYKAKNLNSGTFKKGVDVWNKGLIGLKLKPDKNVYQYSGLTGLYIKYWTTAKEASEILNINEEGIGQCCREKSKTCGGYIWRYKKIDFVEPVVYNNKTNYKILNSLK